MLFVSCVDKSMTTYHKDVENGGEGAKDDTRSTDTKSDRRRTTRFMWTDVSSPRNIQSNKTMNENRNSRRSNNNNSHQSNNHDTHRCNCCCETHARHVRERRRLDPSYEYLLYSSV